LRNFLRLLKKQNRIDGAFLVGGVPWKEYSRDGTNSFPCDLYLMDLDNHWIDRNKDGVLDGYRDIYLDIYVSRILSKENPVEDIRRYFDRAHRHHERGLDPQITRRSYVFKEGAYDVGCGRIHKQVDVSNALVNSTTQAYRREMTQRGGEYICNWGHGNAGGIVYSRFVKEWYEKVVKTQVLQNPSVSDKDKNFFMNHYQPVDHKYVLKEGFEDNEIRELYACMERIGMPDISEWFGSDVISRENHRGFFYNIGSCDTGRFTVSYTCLALAYLTKTDYGLAATASTTTPTIPDAQMFHNILAGRSTFGETLMAFYNLSAAGNECEDMGRVLFGDPTLRFSER
jgi:hypothetical protein